MNIATLHKLRNAQSGVSYNSYLQGVIDRATVLGYAIPPSATLQVISDGLDAIGSTILSATDCLKYYKTGVGYSQFATLNYIDPTVFQSVLVNAPSHTADGFQLTGSEYINSGFAPASGTNYVQDDLMFGLWVKNAPARSSQYLMGVIDTIFSSSSRIVPNLSAGSCVFAANDNGANGGNVGQTDTGLYLVRRDNGTTKSMNINGVDKFLGTSSTPRSLGTDVFAEGAVNNKGSIAGHCVNTIQGAYYGAALTETQCATLNAFI